MFPAAPPTIAPNAMRTTSERWAASRKANAKSVSTASAKIISTTRELPNKPNAPWVF